MYWLCVAKALPLNHFKYFAVASCMNKLIDPVFKLASYKQSLGTEWVDTPALVASYRGSCTTRLFFMLCHVPRMVDWTQQAWRQVTPSSQMLSVRSVSKLFGSTMTVTNLLVCHLPASSTKFTAWWAKNSAVPRYCTHTECLQDLLWICYLDMNT